MRSQEPEASRARASSCNTKREELPPSPQTHCRTRKAPGPSRLRNKRSNMLNEVKTAVGVSPEGPLELVLHCSIESCRT